MAQQTHRVKNIDGVTHIIPKKRYAKRFNKNFRRLTSNLRPLLAIVTLIIVIMLVIFLSHTFKRSSSNQGAQMTALLSKHIIVPQNEQPIIATVTDRSALKTPFLKEANDGDKIVIYEKAKRVIIYRPSVDRIVDIGPVELSNIPKATQ